MDSSQVKRRWSTIVIGGGQSGLAAARALQQRGLDALVLDAAKQVGDAWRGRWDTLRLFTPAQHDGLPGMDFPAPRGAFPTKDEVADYLSDYARRFDLRVLSGQRVSRLSRTSAGFEISCDLGQLSAEQVVVATGTNPRPRVPDFATQLAPSIHQLHSSEYVHPEGLPPGDVLVVGAATSGLEIALELAATHRVTLAGKPTPHIPDPLLRYAGELYWWFVNTVLTIRTPVGRRVRPKFLHGGGPLIRISIADVEAAGVARAERVVGAAGGRPLLADGRALDVATVVWATGFRPDFSWIDLPVTDATGWPVAPRGICRAVDGLYFVGMPFQYGLTSGLIGGVGRDATRVAREIERRTTRRLTALAGLLEARPHGRDVSTVSTESLH